MRDSIVSFPDQPKETQHPLARYYNIHARYILSLLSTSREIQLEKAVTFQATETSFEVRFGIKRVVFDFSDFLELSSYPELEDLDAVFKFHYTTSRYQNVERIYPFFPVSFHEWSLYEKFKRKLTYSAQGKILNNQNSRQYHCMFL